MNTNNASASLVPSLKTTRMLCMLTFPIALFRSSAGTATDTLPAPMLTRSAQTEQSVSLITNARYFEDAKLEEADRFDGFQGDFELTAPVNETMQFRLILPVYTDGTARLTAPPTGERIHIDGTAGTFDFPSVLFDRVQLVNRF